MPRNKHPEETVKKILDVSLRLFVEKGYDQTTVLDIVANLGGLTRGAFYHHFKSKEEVLDAIFTRRFTAKNPFEQAMQQSAENGLERARLAMKIALLGNVETLEDTALSILYIHLMENPRFLAEKIQSDIELAKTFTPIIEEGMADGSIRPGNASLLSELFILLCNLWLSSDVYPRDQKRVLAKAMLIWEIFDGLGFPIINDELNELLLQVIGTLKLEKSPD